MLAQFEKHEDEDEDEVETVQAEPEEESEVVVVKKKKKSAPIWQKLKFCVEAYVKKDSTGLVELELDQSRLAQFAKTRFRQFARDLFTQYGIYSKQCALAVSDFLKKSSPAIKALGEHLHDPRLLVLIGNTQQKEIECYWFNLHERQTEANESLANLETLTDYFSAL